MDIANQLEQLTGKPLDPADQADIQLWEKGRALAHQVNSPGWDVVIEMLQSYVTQHVNTLMATDPINTDEVLATHAVMYAASRIFHLFQEDVARAVEASRKTPEALKQGIRHVLPIPAESL